MEKYEGTMHYKVEEVIKRLQAISFPSKRIKIISGFIEKTIMQNTLPKQVAFAYVDFDLYEPILTALQYLDKVLVKGGIVVVDDYGTFSEGAKIAVDEFFEIHKQKYSFSQPYKFAGYFRILKKIKSSF